MGYQLRSPSAITLREDELKVFREELERCASRLDAEDVESILLAARRCQKHLPGRLLKALVDFRESGNHHAFLYVRGLPRYSKLPPTPYYGSSSPLPLRPALSAMALATVIGEPVGYRQEAGGQILQSIFPTAPNETKLSSQSSRLELKWHTELAFHPYSQDWLVLAGLRGDREGEAMTSVLSFCRVIRQLERSTLHELRKPNFNNGIDPSFGGSERRGVGPRIAILSGHGQDFRVRYDLDLVEPATKEAARALSDLNAVIARTQPSVPRIAIEPSGVLIIDNRRAAHGRSRFHARYDGLDRWLIRVGIRRSLEDCRAVLQGSKRIIGVDFSEQYGAAVLTDDS